MFCGHRETILQREPPREGEGDAVDTKARKVMRADVENKPAHGKKRAYKGGETAECEESILSCAERRAAFEQIKRGRGKHGWYREEEGELNYCVARESDEEAADDGRGGARDSGDHCDDLETADGKCLPIAHLLKVSKSISFLFI